MVHVSQGFNVAVAHMDFSTADGRGRKLGSEFSVCPSKIEWDLTNGPYLQ